MILSKSIYWNTSYIDVGHIWGISELVQMQIHSCVKLATKQNWPIQYLQIQKKLTLQISLLQFSLSHKLFELINICPNSSHLFAFWYLSRFNCGRISLQKWAIQSKWFGWGGGATGIAFDCLQSRFCAAGHRWEKANMVGTILKMAHLSEASKDPKFANLGHF